MKLGEVLNDKQIYLKSDRGRQLENPDNIIAEGTQTHNQ
jgi:hypothetical protein